MHVLFSGERMKQSLILVLVFLLSTFSYASDNQLQSMTSEFAASQNELKSAFKIKSIERLLAQLDLADEKLKNAQKLSSDFVGQTAAEQRLQVRLSSKIARDLHFINRLKEDLGLAAQDSFSVYKELRLSFLKERKQVSSVIKMDQQILLTVEKFFHESQLNRI